MLPTRLRAELDRNFFDLLGRKRRGRNNVGRNESRASIPVSVETCLRFLRNIEKVVIHLFICYFLKNKHLLYLCVHGLEGTKKELRYGAQFISKLHTT